MKISFENFHAIICCSFSVKYRHMADIDSNAVDSNAVEVSVNLMKHTAAAVCKNVQYKPNNSMLSTTPNALSKRDYCSVLYTWPLTPCELYMIINWSTLILYHATSHLVYKNSVSSCSFLVFWAMKLSFELFTTLSIIYFATTMQNLILPWDSMLHLFMPQSTAYAQMWLYIQYAIERARIFINSPGQYTSESMSYWHIWSRANIARQDETKSFDKLPYICYNVDCDHTSYKIFQFTGLKLQKQKSLKGCRGTVLHSACSLMTSQAGMTNSWSLCISNYITVL